MSQHEIDAPAPDTARRGRHTAGAFDIRNFIGALLGLYGLILTLMGLFGDKALDKTGGVNANLYAGIALLVVSAVFVTWARLKPIVVPDDVEPVLDDPTRPAPKRRRGGH
ncbi:MAG: hypothetical protein HOQ18_05950 [Dermatophilaceae bacterium]|nr:hypothetical protein [Dermatophilaceae bacterium]NUO90352.1 hypothetical protein [Dermatophilaceae bacterium]NUQ31546.1 hypothetical protein [Dermatophilaceae bacterium]NUR16906.1 hypothetical protein [Dermatophilaceae bacterium]